MKNKLFLILAILVSFLTINVVKAKDVFQLDWEENQKSAYNNHPFKDGYLAITYNGSDDNLKYYDSEGNLKAEKELTEGYYLDVFSDGDNIYVIICNYSSSSDIYSIQKLDEELNTKTSLDIGNFSYYWPINSSNPFSYAINNNKIYLLTNDWKIVEINTNLSSYQVREYNEQLIKKYFPNHYYEGMFIDELENDDLSIGSIKVSIKDNYIATAYNKYDWVCHDDVAGVSGGVNIQSPSNKSINDSDSKNGKGIETFTECTSAVIELYDKDFNQLWQEEFSGASFTDIHLLSEYIIASIVDSSEKSNIFIYDLKGNKVQTIAPKKNMYYSYLNGNDYSFITATRCSSPYSPGAISEHSPSSPTKGASSCQEYHQVYSIINNIEIKVEGKGKINVAETAKANSEVTFEVIPDTGYVLSEVKVTDAKGNIVTFTDSKFTMPSADVTIEAVFVLAATNPETKDIAIAFILLLSLFSIGFLFVYNKKLKFLK